MTHGHVRREGNVLPNARCVARGVALVALLVLALSTGCARGPHVLPPEERVAIDRALVESPAGFDLEPYAVGFSGPVAMTFDGDGNMIVAEGGLAGDEPRIFGFTPDRKRFDIYPLDTPVLPFTKRKFQLYGPIGSILHHGGNLYVSHRDETGLGVITRMDYKGGHKTVVADLPARGEHGVTDLAVDPRTGRLYFGVGSATNSGVVGMDDYEMGWVKRHPDVHDVPYTPDRELRLWGQRMNSPNPFAYWLAPDIAVTGAFQKLGASSLSRIRGGTLNSPKSNSAIFSCQPDGGDLRVEAHGIRLPRGLAFRPGQGALYFSNQGMEARGTRPVNNDPDSVLRLYAGNYHGWPDYTTDLRDITQPNHQPPQEMISPSGYSELTPLVNMQASGLNLANPRELVVYGVFPSQSGAWGMDFAPANGPFRQFEGSAFVAQFGDRAPFATGGQKLLGPVGFKIVQVEMDRNQVRDFVKNVKQGPASSRGASGWELERPIDVAFGPDGAMYILDFGQLKLQGGRYQSAGGTGRVFRLLPSRNGAAPTL